MDVQWLDQHERLVDIGGRRLHAVAAGEGAPSVVFEGGLGSGIGTWAGLVQRTVSLTSVVAYTRANVGRSDPAPQGRTSRDSIADLHALLATLGAAPPYVIVGHSWGGALALQFAADHPDETAGMVLIDPAHHDASDWVRAQLPPDAVAKSLRVARGARREPG
ncbi:MAG TPA: alpha/beta hydrolase [Chloroflexota bacterium]|nr:alpha/beta hydrolase [Chloroflexota bacterium]